MLSPCKDPQKSLDCIKSMRTSGNCVFSSALGFPTANEDHALIFSWATSSGGDAKMKVRCEQEIDGLGEGGRVLTWK